MLVLTLHSEEFARVAWRSGRRQALVLERETLVQLCSFEGDFVADGDVIVHAPGSEYFAIAFVGSTQTGMDIRQLALIERRVVTRVDIDCVLGWTWVDEFEDVSAALVAAAKEARLRQQRRELATFLHDVGTPLSSIHSSLTAVLEGVVDQSTERRFLRASRDECARVGRLVREFLTVEASEVSVADIAAALPLAVAAVEPLARERGAVVDMSIDRQPAVVAIELDQVVTVLVALIENAIKHGRISGRIAARLQIDAAQCTLTIDDNGPGIPESECERVFNYGIRVSATAGSGIGLARARHFIEKSGGSLGVARSRLGGACFTLRLPLWSNAVPPATIGT